MDVRDEFSVLLRAGTIGSVAVCAISTPLDVARRSVQAAVAARKEVPGLREALRASAREGAVGGLFRGWLPSLTHAALAPGLFLVVYNQQKSGREAVQAGAIARAVQCVTLQPLEFLRTNRQGGALLSPAAAVHLEKSVWDTIVTEGIKSFWRGGIPTLLRDVSASAILWSSYIALQKSVGPGLGDGSPVHSAGFACAGAAVAAVATQPFDVVKTRMQVHQFVRSGEDGYRKIKHVRIFATVREIYSMAGLRGFWTGCVPRTACAAFGGLLLGPLFEYAHVLLEDNERPVRKAFYLPPDTTNRIVHPRSERSMFIEVK